MPCASVAVCESTCSPASIRPRSTEAPACTSPSSSGAAARCRRACAVLRRPARRAGHVRLPDAGRVRRRERRARDPRRRPADRRRRGRCRSRALAHLVRERRRVHLAKLLHGIPHVVTAHSLEPLRPWKAEQLGGGYRVSSWIERTAFEDADAVIAVSAGMRRDILRSYPSIDPERVEVVYNGIDLDRWAPQRRPRHRARARHRSRTPVVVFVGRITRQKGLPYLLRAARCCRPRCSSCSAPARPTPPRSSTRSAGSSTCSAGARRRRLDRPAAAERRAHRPAHRGDRLRLPVGLRAARHRQPRGDGVRRSGRRHRHRRHPRGRRRRRHRRARADRAG